MSLLSNEKIVFLDIDGVMNSIDRAPDDFLPEAVWVLNQLYTRYNAKVVLSSSWKDSWTFDDLKELFQKNGLLIKIIDKTPTFIGSDVEDVSHSEEIMAYINNHALKNYVILDDIDVFSGELKDHFVKTNIQGKNAGLNEKHLEIIEKILEGECVC